jgi:hypothetical protein
MKNEIKLLLTITAASIVSHFVVGAIKNRQYRPCRYAAGESDYERTHPKPCRKPH